MKPNYKNKQTGNIVEYDSFMGMWYSIDKTIVGQPIPYNEYELKNTSIWEELGKNNPYKETILELETARQVCIRKMNTFGFSRTTETLEEWESSGKKAMFEEEIKKQGEWQERLKRINTKLYRLVEENF